MAQTASRNKDLATIDLSMASDTISYGIILELFPQGWFELMDQARAPSYKIENKWYDYHKFSAMGNGFTFEMESLLFFALASAVAEHLEETGPVSVYGDDIIIPTNCSELLIEVLSVCGFSINKEKSFIDGPFRESCGGDYFEGYDVRAFYLKDKISYRVLFLYHNYLVRKGLNFVYVKVFKLIRRLIGRENCESFRGSSIEGDGHLLDLTIADAPHFVVVPVNSSRTCPKYKSFNLLKAWALYRALNAEYDSTICLYMGVNPNTRIPAGRRKKTFKSILSSHLSVSNSRTPIYLI